MGRGSGIAKAIVEACRVQGAEVIAADRNVEALADAYGSMGLPVEKVDVTDEKSVEELANTVGAVDHVVAASARARGRTVKLDRQVVLTSPETKVLGPY